MVSRFLFQSILIGTILSISSSIVRAKQDIIVTPQTYIRAEVDFTFDRIQKNAGGQINKFWHIRKPTPLDSQTVVRMNRDTLYSGAIVDVSQGATITIPEMPDGRYFSVEIVDNDHYAPLVIYQSGTHDLPRGSKYMMLITRIQLLNANDPADVKIVNDLQNQFIIKANSSDLFPDPKWNKESMLALRKKYEAEFQKYTQYEPDWMGPRGVVNEKTRHLAVAGAWGLFPEWDAIYINYSGGHDYTKCYRATYTIPENDAFWSITLYGDDGFMKSNNNIINGQNVKLNKDGTFTAYFGSIEACGDKPNRVDVSKGWNFLMRVYRPGQSVLNRTYKLPTPELVVRKAIKVTEDNFTIAETDKYMSDHVKEHKVNSFRHARETSNIKNQFVIRENQDILYSHAVVDISKGATLVNPEWDVYSVIEVLDENQYVIGVVYPGERLTITKDMVALGNHVFLNMRTGFRSLDEKGLKEAHKHQDSVKILANASTPYVSKGFDRKSLDEMRAKLIKRMPEITDVSVAIGAKKDVDPEKFLIASAAGWGGLPVKDAAYISDVFPPKKAREGACAKMTLPLPPLQFNKGGFFSVTTYDATGWIVEKNFALNNRQAKANKDGSYTFHYNCPGKINNLDVQKNWTQLIRLYRPNSVKEIKDYIKKVRESVRVQVINGSRKERL